MLNRTPPSYSSPESSPGMERDLSDYNSEELQEMGFSPLFSYDKDSRRNTLIDNRINDLVANSATSNKGQSEAERRDNFLAHLNDVRKSAYYRSLKDKFVLNEKLLPGEYIYFALTTDNVNLLNPEALRVITDYYEVPEFTANINILTALRDWQNADNQKTKAVYNALLCDLLNQRAESDSVTFLNLRHAMLSGAELSLTKLNYTDLGAADLSHCHMNNTRFICSNLDGADMSHATSQSADKKNKGFDIKSSLARNACFDAVNAQNIDWGMSDFTGSSFRGAVVGYGTFAGTKFNRANFKGASLRISRNNQGQFSLREANLIDCKLVGQDYTKIDLTGATIFADATFSSVRNLVDQLDDINDGTLEKIKERESSEKFKSEQTNALQQVVAKNIIRHLDKSDLGVDEQVEMYNAAIEHDLFQPNSFFARLANNADRSIFSLGNTIFGDAEQYSTAYATKALELLERARDSLLPEETLRM